MYLSVINMLLIIGAFRVRTRNAPTEPKPQTPPADLADPLNDNL